MAADPRGTHVVRARVDIVAVRVPLACAAPVVGVTAGSSDAEIVGAVVSILGARLCIVGGVATVVAAANGGAGVRVVAVGIDSAFASGERVMAASARGTHIIGALVAIVAISVGSAF
jgi:hypothetical protein